MEAKRIFIEVRVSDKLSGKELELCTLINGTMFTFNKTVKNITLDNLGDNIKVAVKEIKKAVKNYKSKLV